MTDASWRSERDGGLRERHDTGQMTFGDSLTHWFEAYALHNVRLSTCTAYRGYIRDSYHPGARHDDVADGSARTRTSVPCDSQENSAPITITPRLAPHLRDPHAPAQRQPENRLRVAWERSYWHHRRIHDRLFLGAYLRRSITATFAAFRLIQGSWRGNRSTATDHILYPRFHQRRLAAAYSRVRVAGTSLPAVLRARSHRGAMLSQ
jgi:hypothetical protein